MIWIFLHDTTTEKVIVLSRNFWPYFGYYGSRSINDFQIYNNSVWLAGSGRLYRFNVETLQIEDSLKIAVPDSAINVRVIKNYQSDLWIMFDYLDHRNQVVKINSTTGETLETFPKFIASFYYDDDFAFDGSNIWVTNYLNEEYLRRIAYFDPLTGSSNQNENQVPIFESSGLTWDGEHFWVFDRETRSYVKISLEGI